MTTVVVVGSGIAGLTAALHAEAAGCRVTLVTKAALTEANTRYAQGGIAGALSPADRTADHARDTLVAGAGLADPGAVAVLVEEGPDRIRELIAKSKTDAAQCHALAANGRPCLSAVQELYMRLRAQTSPPR